VKDEEREDDNSLTSHISHHHIFIFILHLHIITSQLHRYPDTLPGPGWYGYPVPRHATSAFHREEHSRSSKKE
jgi:hypothetical protein